MSLISPNFDVKSIIFSQFWPEAFSKNCWKKPYMFVVVFEHLYCISSAWNITLLVQSAPSCVALLSLSRDCCVALPHGAMFFSAVCDCGISYHTHFLIFDQSVGIPSKSCWV